MKRKDFDLLRKFMKMTESDNDAEALVAIRKANGVIAKAEVSWDRFFDRAVRIEVEDASSYGEKARGEPAKDVPPRQQDHVPADDEGLHDEPPGYPEGYHEQSQPSNPRAAAVGRLDKEAEEELARVTAAFAVIDEVGVGDEKAKSFIESLRSQWKRKGTLSGPQMAALDKFKAGAERFKNSRGYR